MFAGVGDDKHSWGFDGARAPREGLWNLASNNSAHKFGRETKAGDVVGVEADMDKRRLAFSLNGDWGSPMGSYTDMGVLENIDFVTGLTPGVTVGRYEGHAEVRVNLGGVPFAHTPRPGCMPVQAWINDRRARYLEGQSPSARVTGLTKRIEDLKATPAEEGRGAHEMLMLEAELKEAVLRAEPEKASIGVKLPGGGEDDIIRTRSFQNRGQNRPEDGGQAVVSLRVSSGRSAALLSEDNTVQCKKGAGYPSVVGEMALGPGRWVYEVTIKAMDPATTTASAVLGWAVRTLAP